MSTIPPSYTSIDAPGGNWIAESQIKFQSMQIATERFDRVADVDVYHPAGGTELESLQNGFGYVRLMAEVELAGGEKKTLTGNYSIYTGLVELR
jgi:hypothetical protein